jgi:hypothetical protein
MFDDTMFGQYAGNAAGRNFVLKIMKIPDTYPIQKPVWVPAFGRQRVNVRQTDF